MFNIQDYPRDIVSRITSRLCDVFVETFDITYYHRMSPATEPVKHLKLVVTRQDGAEMTARDFMDFHHFLTEVCYHDPILKDHIEFEDFYFSPNTPLRLVTLGFDLL